MAKNYGYVQMGAASHIARENHLGAPTKPDVQAPPRHPSSKAFESFQAMPTCSALRALSTKQPDALPAGSVAEGRWRT